MQKYKWFAYFCILWAVIMGFAAHPFDAFVLGVAAWCILQLADRRY